MKVLLTGGAGYIGSITAVDLLQENYEVVIIDNFVNSNKSALDAIEKITNKKITFYQGDVRDRKLLDKIFQKEHIDVVIHFAGLKAVGQSVKIPLQYYENNLNCTIVLLQAMLANNVNKLVFSSSATVYHPDNKPKRTEDMAIGTASPYGWSKVMSERIIQDTVYSNPQLSAISLRYFNPVGAHPSGLLGENPKGIPNNLMPYIQQVATGLLEKLTIYGNDYNTADGTCLRDYIHVMDLASGHKAACQYVLNHQGYINVNLGTGKATSVLEMVNAFQQANDIKINYCFGPRREGDLDEYYADCSLAKQLFNWSAKYDVMQMCKDAYNYQIKQKIR